jgi:hypothetical protein
MSQRPGMFIIGCFALAAACDEKEEGAPSADDRSALVAKLVAQEKEVSLYRGSWNGECNPGDTERESTCYTETYLAHFDALREYIECAVRYNPAFIECLVEAKCEDDESEACFDEPNAPEVLCDPLWPSSDAIDTAFDDCRESEG